MRNLPRLFAASVSLQLLLLMAASAGRAQGEIRVAAWNVQGVEFSTGSPQAIKKSARLAEAIKLINPDVIALSEVSSEAEVRRIIANLSNDGQMYRYTMLAHSQPVAQKLAILFRQGVAVSNQRLIPGSDDNQPTRLRKALSARFKSGDFDFLLVAVHHKSGRGAAERRTRTRQNRAIRLFVAQRVGATGEQDVLVVGDYNMIPGADAANFNALSPAAGGLLRFVSTEEFTLPGGFQTSHIGACSQGRPEGNLLDGYAIARAGTGREYVADSAEILPLHQLLGVTCSDYKTRFSDHLPLVARFKTEPPDDDD